MVAKQLTNAGNTDAPSSPLTVRVREACRLTGMGRSKIYMLIKEGHIDVVKVGTMTLIPMGSLEKFLGVEAR